MKKYLKVVSIFTAAIFLSDAAIAQDSTTNPAGYGNPTIPSNHSVTGGTLDNDYSRNSGNNIRNDARNNSEEYNSNTYSGSGSSSKNSKGTLNSRAGGYNQDRSSGSETSDNTNTYKPNY